MVARLEWRAFENRHTASQLVLRGTSSCLVTKVRMLGAAFKLACTEMLIRGELMALWTGVGCDCRKVHTRAASRGPVPNGDHVAGAVA
jgi:hypothetical protein